MFASLESIRMPFLYRVQILFAAVTIFLPNRVAFCQEVEYLSSDNFLVKCKQLLNSSSKHYVLANFSLTLANDTYITGESYNFRSSLSIASDFRLKLENSSLLMTNLKIVAFEDRGDEGPDNFLFEVLGSSSVKLENCSFSSGIRKVLKAKAVGLMNLTNLDFSDILIYRDFVQVEEVTSLFAHLVSFSKCNLTSMGTLISVLRAGEVGFSNSNFAGVKAFGLEKGFFLKFSSIKTISIMNSTFTALNLNNTNLIFFENCNFSSLSNVSFYNAVIFNSSFVASISGHLNISDSYFKNISLTKDSLLFSLTEFFKLKISLSSFAWISSADGCLLFSIKYSNQVEAIKGLLLTELLFKENALGIFIENMEECLIWITDCIFIDNIVNLNTSSDRPKYLYKNSSRNFNAILFNNSYIKGNEFLKNYVVSLGVNWTVIIKHLIIEGNAYIYDSPAVLLFEGNSILFLFSVVLDNVAPGVNGWLLDGDVIFFSACLFLYNDVGHGLILAYQPGLNYEDRKVFFINSTVFGNNGKKPVLELTSRVNFTMYMSKCLFSNNSIAMVGGILRLGCPAFLKKYLLFIEFCDFKYQTAAGAPVLFSSNLNGTIYVRNCRIYNNTSIKNGGVFIITTEKNSTIFLQECEFKMNRAAADGGIVHCILCFLYDINSSYIQSSANQASNIFASSYSNVSMLNTFIKDAYSFGSNNLMFSGFSSVILDRLSIIGSFASKRSACISLYDNANITIRNCVFFNNTAQFGTLLFSCPKSNLIIIKSCVFFWNKAAGSLFYVKSANLNLENIISFGSNGTFLRAEGTQIINLKNFISFKDSCPTNKQSACFITAKKNISFEISNMHIVSFFAIDSPIIRVSQSNFKFSSFFLANTSNLVLSPFIFDNSSVSLQKSIFSIKNVTAFVVTSSSQFDLTSVYFFFYARGRGGLSRALDIMNSTFNIDSCLFFNSNASALRVSFADKSSTVRNSVFLSNRNIDFGGAVILLSSKVSLEFNIFFNNTVGGFAGAIYIQNDNQFASFSEIKIVKNFFAFNQASFSGGAIYWNSIVPVETYDNKFLNNRALFGQNMSSQPFSLTTEPSKNAGEIGDYSSGELLPELELKLLDFYEQTYLVNFSRGAKISIENFTNEDRNYSGERRPMIKGTLSLDINAGVIILQGLSVIAIPGTEFDLKIEFDLRLMQHMTIPIPNRVIHETNFNISFLIKIKVSQCKTGQIFHKLMKKCDFCSKGTFSLKYSFQEECKVCPKNADCPGGNELRVHKNFWRFSLLSENIYECLNPDACFGGFELVCSKNFGGNLCGLCKKEMNLSNSENLVVSSVDSIMDTNYFLDLDNKCKECSTTELQRSIAFGIILFLATLSYMTFVIRDRLRNRISTCSGLLKILTDFLQVTSLIKTIKFEFSINLQNFFDLFQTLNNPENVMLGIDCYINRWIAFELNPYFKKVILHTVLCISIPWGIFIFWMIYGKIKKYSFKIIKSKISLSLTIAFFTYQPMFVKYYFDALYCVKIERKWFIAKYLSEECWTPNHLKLIFIIILPFFSILMIIYPAKLILSMRKSQKLGRESYEFSFLTSSFDNSYYGWDFICMTQKYLLIFISTFIVNADFLVIGNLFITNVFAYFQFQAKPYKISLTNHIASQARLCSLVTVILQFLNSHSHGFIWLNILSFVIYVALHLSFFASWVRAYLILDKVALGFLRRLFFCFKIEIIHRKGESSLSIIRRARSIVRKRPANFLKSKPMLDLESQSEVL